MRILHSLILRYWHSDLVSGSKCETFQFPFNAMGCPCEIRLQGADFEQLKAAADHCIAEARRFETKYSRYTRDSVTTCINTSAGKAATVIDFETYAILQYAAVCYEQSDGLFDITSGVLRRVWNKSRVTLPTPAELNACTDLIGWDKVELDEDSVRLPVEGMEIDFGGVTRR